MCQSHDSLKILLTDLQAHHLIVQGAKLADQHALGLNKVKHRVFDSDIKAHFI